MIEIDLSYTGSAQLSLETGAALNTASVKIDVIPIGLEITRVRFQLRARITVDLTQLPLAKWVLTVVAADPKPLVLFDVEPSVGHLHWLDRLPLVRAAMEQALKAKFAKDLIAPNSMEFEAKLW